MNNLTNDNLKIVQPENLNIQLMEHQKTIIKTMIDFESNGYINIENFKCFSNKPQNIKIESSIGILGDKVGSGKSIMIITLILLNNTISERPEYFESQRYISIKLTDNPYKNIKSNLVIVPHKILNQWEKFFTLAPSLKIFVYDNKTENETSYENLKKYDVILIPCLKVDNFFLKTINLKWDRIFIDEADTIKLPKTIELNSKFIWLITGTPSGLIYNNKPYITNLLKKNKDWIINYLTVKNNDEFIEDSIKLPVPLRISIKCNTPCELKIHEFIPQNIINMINAGNTEEAIKMLNCNEDTDDNILKVLTRNITEAIKNKNIELEAEKKKKYFGNGQNEQEKKIKTLERVIVRLNDRYNNIKKKINELNEEYCPICLDNFTKPVILGCCKNIYCFECLTLISKNNKCPNCSAHLEKKNINIITKKNKNITSMKLTKKEIKLKEKIDVLIELLNNKPDGKFMIFANYTETFMKIEKMLIENKITYSILKGNASSVNRYIEDFKNGIIKVIMLNARHFGAGMNLQMATDIILYHRFTRELEEQIIGRAQRIGRVGKLNVYYLLHDNENNALNNEEKFEDIDYIKYLESI